MNNAVLEILNKLSATRMAASLALMLLIELSAGDLAAQTPGSFTHGEATFGIVRDGMTAAITRIGAWMWKGGEWVRDDALMAGLDAAPAEVRLLRDFDNDGACELLVNHDIFTWNEKTKRWQPADYSLPPDCAVLNAQGGDNGLRFADLNGDGFGDVIQSNEAGYAIYLWAGKVNPALGWSHGWPHLVAKGSASSDITKAKVLSFVEDGLDSGAQFQRDSIVWKNKVGGERVSRTFREIIAYDMPVPKSPGDSLKAMRPRPGFMVELVASEPLIKSPSVFDWDAQGRLWVVEMPDYPLGMDGKGKPGGMVKILTDTDGDGRYDEAKIFLEDLSFPTGIMPWRKGVLIASSPSIIFAADTDGDGRADERRVIFTGFKEGNQQHRVNGFEWGLDGWIYGANGDSGGRINGVSISGRDFRFRPDSGEFEPESGATQYRRTRDDWGNWFGNFNSAWLWHYTMADSCLRRNPRLAVKTTKKLLANYPDSTRVFAVSDLQIRFNTPRSAGHLTSGCGSALNRDELFGHSFATSVFICEPVHNVVHREVLAPDGATFTSKRADDEQDREFLASTDPWFRPVLARTGPDGALYIADFYRFVLEHPEWIAPETLSRLDLRAGEDKGRIYRVFPVGAKLRAVPNLAKLDSAALVAAIDSPNGWQRDTVQRLLYERNAKDASPALRQVAMNAQNPKVRVQALAALDTLQNLDPGIIRDALRDRDAHVRVQALRVSESLAAAPDEVLPAMLACVKDADFIVRHQLALSLGAFRNERATAALAELAEGEGTEPQMRLAIMSSLQPDSALFVKLNKTSQPVATAAVVLPMPSTPDRAKVIASFATVTALKGAAEHGHELFKQACMVCHRLKNEGMEVGPDLGMVADKPVDWLLTAIFDPNAAIEDRFKTQTLRLKSGAEIAGIISAETANNVVLRLPGGVDLPVLRDDIASQAATGRSLMPEGMETVMKPQDVADLIAYLRSALQAVKP